MRGTKEEEKLNRAERTAAKFRRAGANLTFGLDPNATLSLSPFGA